MSHTSSIARLATAATAASMSNPDAGLAHVLADLVAELSEIADSATPESLPEIERACVALVNAAKLQA